MEQTNPSTPSDSTTKIIWGIIIVVILGVGIFFLVRKPAGDQSAEVSPSPETSSSAMAQANDITVGNQFPGKTTYFDSVTLANGGWVVVHESDGGKPGKVIGAKWFPAGTNPGSVALTGTMVAGKEYIVMLHSDNGDKVFSEATDPAILDSNGNPVMKTIKATLTPEQVKG